MTTVFAPVLVTEIRPQQQPSVRTSVDVAAFTGSPAVAMELTMVVSGRGSPSSDMASCAVPATVELMFAEKWTSYTAHFARSVTMPLFGRWDVSQPVFRMFVSKTADWLGWTVCSVELDTSITSYPFQGQRGALRPPNKTIT